MTFITVRGDLVEIWGPLIEAVRRGKKWSVDESLGMTPIHSIA